MKLSPQHRRAITLLSEGLPNKIVAQELNIVPETISRWRADFDFKSSLNSLLSENQALLTNAS